MKLPELKIKQEYEGDLHIIPEDATDFLAFVDLANSPELRKQISEEIIHRCNCFDELLKACKAALPHIECVNSEQSNIISLVGETIANAERDKS